MSKYRYRQCLDCGQFIVDGPADDPAVTYAVGHVCSSYKLPYLESRWYDHPTIDDLKINGFEMNKLLFWFFDKMTTPETWPDLDFLWTRNYKG